MVIAFLIGRIIVGVYFLFNAYNHFTQWKRMSGYAQSKGVPAPQVAVLGSGVLLLIGGLSILTGFQPLIGVAALVLFLVPITFTMHAFWQDKDPMARMGNRINFTKNMALMGSALVFSGIPQPWPFSIG